MLVRGTVWVLFFGYVEPIDPPPINQSNEQASKPPPGKKTLTHRSMEIQLTDFENAAFTVFIILLTRVILAFDLSLYIPLSKVRENIYN